MQATSRVTDPDTSQAAAVKVEATGGADRQRLTCLWEVRRLSGQTAAEIAQATGLERHVPSRRLPELRQAGEVKNGWSRECHETGNLSMTWYQADSDAPVIEAQQWLAEWHERHGFFNPTNVIPDRRDD